jgi:hypothetical protein
MVDNPLPFTSNPLISQHRPDLSCVDSYPMNSTDRIVGRCFATSSQLSPSSRLR